MTSSLSNSRNVDSDVRRTVSNSHLRRAVPESQHHLYQNQQVGFIYTGNSCLPLDIKPILLTIYVTKRHLESFLSVPINNRILLLHDSTDLRRRVISNCSHFSLLKLFLSQEYHRHQSQKKRRIIIASHLFFHYNQI